VEVLAREIGHRGVAVNSILPTAIEGAGVFTEEVRPEIREFIKSFRPMQRMGTMDDVANAAEYGASDLSAFVSGQASSAQRRRTRVACHFANYLA
jgi:3-oxoacyl-[acyl-carrier protein] reductase